MTFICTFQINDSISNRAHKIFAMRHEMNQYSYQIMCNWRVCVCDCKKSDTLIFSIDSHFDSVTLWLPTFFLSSKSFVGLSQREAATVNARISTFSLVLYAIFIDRKYLLKQLIKIFYLKCMFKTFPLPIFLILFTSSLFLRVHSFKHSVPSITYMISMLS